MAPAGPSLRLSGGAAGLQAAVLDGIKATDIDGTEVDLGKYSSVPAVLVVNLASGATALRRSGRCGTALCADARGVCALTVSPLPLLSLQHEA